VCRLPEAEREYKFHPVREWVFDFAWPERMMSVEIDGGTHTNGRHNRHYGYEEDCRKIAEAILLGWTVFRFTGDMVKNGEAIQFMNRYFDNLI